jgi:hypothetical protein
MTCGPPVIETAKATTAAIAVAANRTRCISKVPPTGTRPDLVGGIEAIEDATRRYFTGRLVSDAAVLHELYGAPFPKASRQEMSLSKLS